MKNNLLQKLYTFHDCSLRPPAFAAWARADAASLNDKRTRYLGRNKESVWDIKKTETE